jgi:hypothetical protein
MKMKNFSKISIAAIAAAMISLCGCSNVDKRTQAFLDKGEDFVTDSMPGNGKEICTYADINGGKVLYAVTDAENSKIDNESDYYPTLYIYNLKTGLDESIELRGGLYSPTKQEISIHCLKGFKALNDNKDVILVGTNGNHMGRGLIAVKYDVIKGTFNLLFENIGSKIWIEDGKIGIHQESSGSAAYNFTKVYYDYNGKILK